MTLRVRYSSTTVPQPLRSDIRVTHAKLGGCRRGRTMSATTRTGADTGAVSQ